MGTQTRASAMAQRKVTPEELEALIEEGVDGVNASLRMLNALAEATNTEDREDMQECVSTLRTSRTRIQQGAAQLIRIYQDEMVASKESDRLVEESLEALFEQGIGSAGLSAGNAGDDGGASRAELEKAETEIALLRSQLDAAHEGHNADPELRGQVELLARAVQDREEEISELTCRIEELENELDEAEGVNQHLTEMLMKHNGDMAESSDDSGGE